jgi:hypothetical protein
MKNILYSTKLDNMFKDINSNTLNHIQFKRIQKNTQDINELFKTENLYMDKFSTSLSFRKKYKNATKHEQISDIVLGILAKKNIKDRKASVVSRQTDEINETYSFIKTKRDSTLTSKLNFNLGEEMQRINETLNDAKNMKIGNKCITFRTSR